MRSNYETKKWIDKVIKSCKTWEQTTTAERLVENFNLKLKDSDYDRLLGIPLMISLENSLKQKRKSLIEGSNLVINN